jgi:histidine triad (HIT) family protein
MTSDPNCIFCKIIQGQIPSTRVYEDEKHLAFMDINPLNRGHCLMIPKDHHPTIHDIPDDLLAGLMIAAKKLAGRVVRALGAQGINLIQSNGRAANQIIDHFHLHLVPRWRPDDLPVANWDLKPGAPEEIATAAEAIRQAT